MGTRLARSAFGIGGIRGVHSVVGGGGEAVSAQCTPLPPQLQMQPIGSSIYEVDGKSSGGILNVAFSQLHHPSAPVSTELLLDLYSPHNASSPSSPSPYDPYGTCQQVYLTRTGSYAKMPNKCQAVAYVRSAHHDASAHVISHRVGTSAKLTNQYVGDTVDAPALHDEKIFLPLFLHHRAHLVDLFLQKMGPPLEGTLRRSVTVMVANEGVIDLVLNFLCSTRAAGLNLGKSLVVFVGQQELVPVVESLGVIAFFHKAMGDIPKKAAGFYGDDTFGVLMWLKTTSVYVASAAGFNVLFQDADLVWIRDPLPLLLRSGHDIAFMDDGARTPRFTPFFVNSGFYFQRYNENSLFLMEKMLKAVGEISATKSHQAILTRHITEAHHLAGLQVGVLSQEDFPSGIMYHHNKSFIRAIKAYTATPVVFHMCWTQSRTEKVTYFKDIGMWFLPEDEVCVRPQQMLQWGRQSKGGILQHCCQAGEYWANKTRHI